MVAELQQVWMNFHWSQVVSLSRQWCKLIRQQSWPSSQCSWHYFYHELDHDSRHTCSRCPHKSTR